MGALMHDDVKIMARERPDSIGGNKDHPPWLVGNSGSKRKLSGYYARRKVRRPDTIAEQPFHFRAVAQNLGASFAMKSAIIHGVDHEHKPMMQLFLSQAHWLSI